MLELSWNIEQNEQEEINTKYTTELAEPST